MKSYFKILIIQFFLLNVLSIQAAEVEVDARLLERNATIYLIESGLLNRIPDTGLVKLDVSDLPTLIKIVSVEKGKILTHRIIWLTGNTVKILGSIANNKIELTSDSMGEILADGIEKEWTQFDFEKNLQETISKPFQVYLLNQIKFQKTEDLEKIIEAIPENERDFWATARIVKYLEDLQSIGFDPAKMKFEHLTAINKNGLSEKFERPKSKFLLIDFSSSGCRPCLADIDKLVQLKKEHEADLEMLSIWDDTKQEPWLNIAKEQKNKITWVSLRDDSQAIFEKFEIDVYPTYMLIDRSGHVVKKWKGSGIDKVGKYLK